MLQRESGTKAVLLTAATRCAARPSARSLGDPDPITGVLVTTPHPSAARGQGHRWGCLDVQQPDATGISDDQVGRNEILELGNYCRGDAARPGRTLPPLDRNLLAPPGGHLSPTPILALHIISTLTPLLHPGPTTCSPRQVHHMVRRRAGPRAAESQCTVPPCSPRESTVGSQPTWPPAWSRPQPRPAQSAPRAAPPCARGWPCSWHGAPRTGRQWPSRGPAPPSACGWPPSAHACS